MAKLVFPDGNVREYDNKTALEIAESISISLKKKVISAKLDEDYIELNKPITKDGHLKLIVADDEDQDSLYVLRHSSAHLLAQALRRLYGKDVHFGVGPAIDGGFYYDFDSEYKISEEDFKNIEKEMKKIISENVAIEGREVSRTEALEIFAADPYKVELINDLPEDEVITVYTQGDFVDLCRGGHVASTSKIKEFKLLSVAGAYWRGNSDNKMLQRIYGTAYFTKEHLEQHLVRLQEARERDHRKLGKELGIFTTSQKVGAGLPLWLPNGMTVRRLLSDYIMDKEIARGYQHVLTPSVASTKLYKISGHLAHYKDDMFPIMERDDDEFVLRPMNCPEHMIIYKSQLHSYRDLPIRIAEIANDFRFEASGALTGIERSRAFTQNDSHIFCTEEQIASEIKAVTELILDVYKDFNLNQFEFRLSLRDKENTEKYFGNDELWERSESELREVLKEMNVPYYEAEGEAAFYGPKIDVQVRSALGHDVTLSTIQLDYQLPERFELEYVANGGEKKRPVVIHRAILGSIDRFIAFLLEETKGILPLWLAPRQAVVIPVSPEAHGEYAKKVVEELRKIGVRTELDDRNEKLGYRIREAQTNKLPIEVVVGDGEIENNGITLRRYGSRQETKMSLEEFLSAIKAEIDEKRLAPEVQKE